MRASAPFSLRAFGFAQFSQFSVIVVIVSNRRRGIVAYEEIRSAFYSNKRVPGCDVCQQRARSAASRRALSQNGCARSRYSHRSCLQRFDITPWDAGSSSSLTTLLYRRALVVIRHVCRVP